MRTKQVLSVILPILCALPLGGATNGLGRVQSHLLGNGQVYRVSLRVRKENGRELSYTLMFYRKNAALQALEWVSPDFTRGDRAVSGARPTSRCV